MPSTGIPFLLVHSANDSFPPLTLLVKRLYVPVGSIHPSKGGKKPTNNHESMFLVVVPHRRCDRIVRSSDHHYHTNHGAALWDDDDSPRQCHLPQRTGGSNTSQQGPGLRLQGLSQPWRWCLAREGHSTGEETRVSHPKDTPSRMRLLLPHRNVPWVKKRFPVYEC